MEEHGTLMRTLWRWAGMSAVVGPGATASMDLAPLGLTHIQYVILASLYGLSMRGARPSQRELAESAGLEPVYVSRLVRGLEEAGLLLRTEAPADSRAVQLTLTERGSQRAAEAIAIVGQLYEDLTLPSGALAARTTGSWSAPSASCSAHRAQTSTRRKT